MGNKKDALSVNMEYDEAQTIPLALHEMHMARATWPLWWSVSDGRRTVGLCPGGHVLHVPGP